MKRVLVTGAGGVVGRRLVPALADAGWTVLATSHTAAPGAAPLDVTAASDVDRALGDLGPDDAVVHLAAIAHRVHGVSDDEYRLANEVGTRNVVDGARRAGVGRVVVFSTADVYGAQRSREPVPEDAPLRPVGAYARSKAAAETHCRRAAEEGLACVVYRFPVIYSPEWLVAIRRRVRFPATGGRVHMRLFGSQPRYSMCGLPGAVQAVQFALENALPAGVYNVADAQVYSHEDLRHAVGVIDGRRPWLPVPNLMDLPALRHLSVVPLSQSMKWELALKLLVGYVLDTSRLRSFGWRPQSSLADLLAGARA